MWKVYACVILPLTIMVYARISPPLDFRDPSIQNDNTPPSAVSLTCISTEVCLLEKSLHNAVSIYIPWLHLVFSLSFYGLPSFRLDYLVLS
jgi:hypothetical protein